MPKRFNSLQNEYRLVEIVHVTNEFSKKGASIDNEPYYDVFVLVTTREHEFVFQRQSYDQMDLPE